MSADEDTDDAEAAAAGWQRIDRWLWCARFLKTRALAATLVSRGKLRINRMPTDKPHARVRKGDVLTFGLGPGVRVVRVLALGERRGPPAQARTLYEDLDPPLKQP